MADVGNRVGPAAPGHVPPHRSQRVQTVPGADAATRPFVRWSYDPGVEQDSGAEPAVDSDLRKLRCFIAVAERCTAQPALSRQIQRLEEQLGVALFPRTSRSVELTDAGRELVS